VPHSHHAVTGANEQFLKNVLATCCGYPHETMTAVNYICSPNLHTPFITTFKHENLCKLQFVLLTRDVFYYFLAIGESNYNIMASQLKAPEFKDNASWHVTGLAKLYGLRGYLGR
jgi:hypothetical protein